jgi:hypothetical protein
MDLVRNKHARRRPVNIQLKPKPRRRRTGRAAAQHLRRQPRHRPHRGLWHIIEGPLQASGRAGTRQVKDANVSFVGASAPIVTGTTFIFVSEPY